MSHVPEVYENCRLLHFIVGAHVAWLVGTRLFVFTFRLALGRLRARSVSIFATLDNSYVATATFSFFPYSKTYLIPWYLFYYLEHFLVDSDASLYYNGTFQFNLRYFLLLFYLLRLTTFSSFIKSRFIDYLHILFEK